MVRYEQSVGSLEEKESSRTLTYRENANMPSITAQNTVETTLLKTLQAFFLLLF